MKLDAIFIGYSKGEIKPYSAMGWSFSYKGVGFTTIGSGSSCGGEDVVAEDYNKSMAKV